MAKKTSSKVIKNGAKVATIGTVIAIGLLMLPTLSFQEVAESPFETGFDMLKDALAIWIAIFSVETGYTMLWLRTELSNVIAAKGDPEICIEKGMTVSSIMRCYDK